MSYRMKLADLCANYAPVYPYEYRDWDVTTAYLLSCPEERKILLELAKVLKKEGRFRKPIRIGDGYWGDEGDGEVLSVTDGTHRVVTARLVNLDEIDVVDDTETNDHVPCRFLKVDVKLVDSVFTVANSDAFVDILFDNLRSIKMSDTVWVNCDTSVGSGVESSYYYVLDDIPDGFMEQFLVKLEEIFEGLGFSSYIETVRVQEDAQENNVDEE